ncbi:hypothetical protein B0I74DRAFT_167449 [Yarrowia lipolytica]|nr:hypothetical protein B0I74DRAFT_167449 [Yarrowia lipolytica]
MASITGDICTSGFPDQITALVVVFCAIKHALIAPQKSEENSELDSSYDSDSEAPEQPDTTTRTKKIFNPSIHQQEDTSLKVQTAGVYSTFATSYFNQMSLLSALSVVRAVMYIATRPILAKFADVLGRFETLLLSVIIFTIGFIILAASPSIGTYFGAHISTCIQFMEQVFAADTYNLKNRAYFVVLPNICYLFVPALSTWSWGYVLTIMFRHKIRARALGLECGKAVLNFRVTIAQFDIAGLILFTGGAFLSFSSLKDRTLITGCAVVALYSLAYYIYSPYYYAWLLVCKGLSVTAATNVTSVWVVGYTAGSLIVALIIKYVLYSNRFKPIIVVGGRLYMLGLGLTYQYKQPYHSLAQFIVAQVIKGLGTLQFPVLVMIQSATVIFDSSISVGTAVGDAISGSLYQQQYPKKLAEFASSLSEAERDKMTPLKIARGSPERDSRVVVFDNVY